MSSSAKVPGLARAMVIEWRARRIADPLCRLKYLRGVTGGGGGPFGRWARVACGLAWLLIPLVPAREAVLAPAAVNLQTEPPPAVWLVESGADHETYSNGLRIETRYAIETHHRAYGVFERGQTESDRWQPRTEPAGILYHATESDLAPFAAEQNARLQRIDEAMLDYLRRRQSYNFVIDRFGRVYRVVAESDAANHAGHSVWADARWVYCNLNAAFLGIAFEARTEAGHEAALEAAQIRAGRALTDMLRSRYRIPAEDCVTHAQVSVNPGNRKIGFHTDWAARFPWAELGLANNYRLPVAAMLVFGFGYDEALVRASGGRAWAGLESAAESVAEQAAGKNVSSAEWMRRLQKTYSRRMAALHLSRAMEESSDGKE